MGPDTAQNVLGASQSKSGGSWHRQAACIDTPSIVMDGATKANREKALTICLHCPVRIQCLAEARELGVEYGIRGGKVLHKV